MISVTRSFVPSCKFRLIGYIMRNRTISAAKHEQSATPTAASDTKMANTSIPRKRKPVQVARTPKKATLDASQSTAAAAQPSIGLTRCNWAGAFSGAASEQYTRYHDKEWGRPVYDDKALFELLVLEGAQAGLSWSTILARRECYRTAFEGFDPVKVAAFDDAKLTQLMAEGSGVVRHKGKLESAVQNAKAFLQLQQEHGSFCKFVWSFVPNGQPIVNSWTSISEVPTKTLESEALSKALKKAGMSFVGPTIMYAFMQAAGLVNDHTIDCYCYSQVIATDQAQQQAQDPADDNSGGHMEQQQLLESSIQRNRRRRLQK